MDSKTTLSVAQFDRRNLPKRQSSTQKRVFTDVVASCQLMLDRGGALFEFSLTDKCTPIVVGREKHDVEPTVHIDLVPYNGHDLGVSRLHARFERHGSRIFIRDLESTNGTWVNGERIPAMNVYEIYHGDKIEFGRLSSVLYIKS